ncbi:MAG: toll/interleukin-1 receptor domain-containing protein [Acidobacteria bacterium]|nr:toll/interleukin-1 receptor domain-containing protein [Acidobacteriota bacterium]
MSRPTDSFIFVSYSNRDSDFVHSEIKRLEMQGYKIWYDKGKLQPGLAWDKEISKAIKACACFIVFITQDALDSPNVCIEIDQALEAGKPFICIYWEKVELPSRFQKPIRSIQALERYALRRIEYEEPLSRALSEYVECSPVEHTETPVETPVPPSPVIQTNILPKILFLSLILLVVLFVFLAVVATIAPHLASYPGDPLGNRLSGFLVSFVFIAIAFGLGGGALAVYRIYLKREKREDG